MIIMSRTWDKWSLSLQLWLKLWPIHWTTRIYGEQSLSLFVTRVLHIARIINVYSVNPRSILSVCGPRCAHDQSDPTLDRYPSSSFQWSARIVTKKYVLTRFENSYIYILYFFWELPPTWTSPSDDSLADNFTDESTTANMNCEILITQLFQLSLLSPALESLLDGFASLIWKGETKGQGLLAGKLDFVKSRRTLAGIVPFQRSQGLDVWRPRTVLKIPDTRQ